MSARILMVEDDPDQSELFSHVLRTSGYAVAAVATAEAAQARLAAEPFALLLADWDLPGRMNGDALIQWAKAQNPNIKAILFSNHPQVDELAAACGANAAFRKIDGIVKLRHLITDLLPLDDPAPPPEGGGQQWQAR